jgi:hypothetical protein
MFSQRSYRFSVPLAHGARGFELRQVGSAPKLERSLEVGYDIRPAPLDGEPIDH